MASGPSDGPHGGSRALTGRRLDPIRKYFQPINSAENMGKPPRQRQSRCKLCMESVSGRPERMKKHVAKCKAHQAPLQVICK